MRAGRRSCSPDEPARIAFFWRLEDKAQALFVALALHAVQSTSLALEAYRSRLPETHAIDRLIGTSSELLGGIAVKMISNPGRSGFSCIGMQAHTPRNRTLAGVGRKSVAFLFVDWQPSCLLPPRVSPHLLEAFHGFAQQGIIETASRFKMRTQMFSLLRIYLQGQFQQERGRFRSFAHTHLFFSGLAKAETFPPSQAPNKEGAFLPRLKDGGYLRSFSVCVHEVYLRWLTNESFCG